MAMKPRAMKKPVAMKRGGTAKKMMRGGATKKKPMAMKRGGAMKK